VTAEINTSDDKGNSEQRHRDPEDRALAIPARNKGRKYQFQQN